MKTYPRSPTPWRVASNGASTKVVDAEEKAVCMITARKNIWNGDLLAAAPEMYSALIGLIEQVYEDIPAESMTKHMYEALEDARCAVVYAAKEEPCYDEATRARKVVVEGEIR